MMTPCPAGHWQITSLIDRHGLNLQPRTALKDLSARMPVRDACYCWVSIRRGLRDISGPATGQETPRCLERDDRSMRGTPSSEASLRELTA